MIQRGDRWPVMKIERGQRFKSGGLFRKLVGSWGQGGGSRKTRGSLSGEASCRIAGHLTRGKKLLRWNCKSFRRKRGADEQTNKDIGIALFFLRPPSCCCTSGNFFYYDFYHRFRPSFLPLPAPKEPLQIFFFSGSLNKIEEKKSETEVKEHKVAGYSLARSPARRTKKRLKR